MNTPALSLRARGPVDENDPPVKKNKKTNLVKTFPGKRRNPKKDNPSMNFHKKKHKWVAQSKNY